MALNNHYVLQVKENQPTLQKEIIKTIKNTQPLDSHEEFEKDHGRQTIWKTMVYDATQSPKTKDWTNLKSFIYVWKQCTEKGKTVISEKYCISDVDYSAEHFFKGIRGHWKIENCLHWVKDVIHGEDDNRIRIKNGPVNVSIFSSIAINILRKKRTMSITDEQIKFGANLKKSLQILRS